MYTCTCIFFLNSSQLLIHVSPNYMLRCTRTTVHVYTYCIPSFFSGLCSSALLLLCPLSKSKSAMFCVTVVELTWLIHFCCYFLSSSRSGLVGTTEESGSKVKTAMIGWLLKWVRIIIVLYGTYIIYTL